MNGNEWEQGKQSARELTEEIDRATNIAVEDLEKEQQRELDRGQAGTLGSKVLTYNPEASVSGVGQVLTYNPDQAVMPAEQRVEQSNTLVRQMAAVENYGEQVLENPVLAGAGSKRQAEERMAEDAEDLANEEGFSPYAQNIMERNNKRITGETVARVDKMIADNNYHPAQLEEMTNKARIVFLKDVFNRIFKSRN